MAASSLAARASYVAVQDGDAVGVFDGVGVVEGVPVAVGVGRRGRGSCGGTRVGDTGGSEAEGGGIVGLTVGWAVGVGCGVAVGVAVGLAVTVGLGVDVAVGEAVGVGEGVGVGRGVGVGGGGGGGGGAAGRRQPEASPPRADDQDASSVTTRDPSSLIENNRLRSPAAVWTTYNLSRPPNTAELYECRRGNSGNDATARTLPLEGSMRTTCAGPNPSVVTPYNHPDAGSAAKSSTE